MNSGREWTCRCGLDLEVFAWFGPCGSTGGTISNTPLVLACPAERAHFCRQRRTAQIPPAVCLGCFTTEHAFAPNVNRRLYCFYDPVVQANLLWLSGMIE